MDPLSIISKSPPLAPRGQAYSAQLQAIGGTPPYSWSVVSGALPTGIALSSSGLLSAAGGAIPESAIGTHSFDVQVEDSIPDTDVISMTIEVVPYGFDRVIEFLVDSRFRGLLDTLELDQVTREKMEKHFFRGPLGDPEDTFVHLTRDILGEDWPTGGVDTSLRDILDALDLATKEAVQTLNTVPPDPGTQDFEMRAGPGINISPITNGLEIAGDDLQKIEKISASGSVGPGGTLELVTDVHPDLYMAQIEAEPDIWYPIDNVPAFAGKKLLNNVVAGSGGVLAFAVGDVSSNPKVHVFWEDGGTLHLTRFNGVNLSMEEDFTWASPAPLAGEPIVMVSDLGKVIVAWVDNTNAMYYGVFNPATYTDTTSPAYLNPPISQVVGVASPCPTISRLIGAMPPAGPSAGVCFVGLDVGGTPTVAEFDTATPGGTGGYTGISATGPGGGAFLDLIIDSTTPSIYTLGVDGFVGGADTLEMGALGLPLAAAPFVTTPIDGPYPLGTYFEDAIMMIDDGPLGPATRSITISYILTNGSVFPNFGQLYVAVQDGVQAWPPGPSPILFAVERVQDTKATKSRFVRAWDSAGDPKCDAYMVDVESSETADAIMRRLHFAPNIGVLEGETVHSVLKTAPSWLISGHTSEATVNAWQPRILSSLDVFSSVSETFNSKTLNLHYDTVLDKLILANDSPFDWNAIIEAAVLTGGSTFPPNLMIPCYQLAQALKDYEGDAGFYPSPSTSAGVTWSETQLASANTGGYTFSTYYSVVPGSYDMHGGSVAQAFYYSDEAATLASDQTLVFRYNYMPAEILAAEAVIAADITANLPLTHPSVGGAANPNFYTLAELDVQLGSSYATTYSGPPFDYYRYFCFLDNAGAVYHQGWFSQNYVDTALAYGPHATTNPTIPVGERFIQATNETQGVPTLFTLAGPVATAHMYINGVRYFRDIDWVFGSGMHEISYLNRVGTVNNPGYTLHQYDEVTFDKYLL
jgi:hypothetical protein